MTEVTTQINKGETPRSLHKPGDVCFSRDSLPRSRKSAGARQGLGKDKGETPSRTQDTSMPQISSDKKFVEVVNYLHRKLRNPQSLVSPSTELTSPNAILEVISNGDAFCPSLDEVMGVLSKVVLSPFPLDPGSRLMETPMVSFCLPMHLKRCLDSSHLNKMRR